MPFDHHCLASVLQIDAIGNESVWGRPDHEQQLLDGALLLSDDLAGAVYPVRYAP